MARLLRVPIAALRVGSIASLLLVQRANLGGRLACLPKRERGQPCECHVGDCAPYYTAKRPRTVIRAHGGDDAPPQTYCRCRPLLFSNPIMDVHACSGIPLELCIVLPQIHQETVPTSEHG